MSKRSRRGAPKAAAAPKEAREVSELPSGLRVSHFRFTKEGRFVELVVGDCFQWCSENAPEAGTSEDTENETGDVGFDRMLVTGSCPELEDTLCNMIKPDGKLVAIVGHDPAMQVVVRDGRGTTQISSADGPVRSTT